MLVVAIMTNVPRFLEMEHVWDTVEKTVEDPDTGTIHKVSFFMVALGGEETRGGGSLSSLVSVCPHSCSSTPRR